MAATIGPPDGGSDGPTFGFGGAHESNGLRCAPRETATAARPSRARAIASRLAASSAWRNASRSTVSAASRSRGDVRHTQVHFSVGEKHLRGCCLRYADASSSGAPPPRTGSEQEGPAQGEQGECESPVVVQFSKLVDRLLQQACADDGSVSAVMSPRGTDAVAAAARLPSCRCSWTAMVRAGAHADSRRDRTREAQNLAASARCASVSALDGRVVRPSRPSGQEPALPPPQLPQRRAQLCSQAVLVVGDHHRIAASSSRYQQ